MYWQRQQMQCPECQGLLVATVWDGARIACPWCGSVSEFRLAAPTTPAPAGETTVGSSLLKACGIGLALVVAYKGLQALLDEDFGDGEFPRWFRDDERAGHVAMHGPNCLDCGRRVRVADLTVDHIVSLKNGGRTSRMNADVTCLSCNSRKGAKNSLFDYIRGRSL